MSKDNIVVAVYTNKTPDSKNYIIDSFSQRLIQAFNNCGVKAYSYDYCKENNIISVEKESFKEYAEKIDDYFTRFGYQVNKLKIPT